LRRNDLRRQLGKFGVAVREPGEPDAGCAIVGDHLGDGRLPDDWAIHTPKKRHAADGALASDNGWPAPKRIQKQIAGFWRSGGRSNETGPPVLKHSMLEWNRFSHGSMDIDLSGDKPTTMTRARDWKWSI